MSQTSPRMLWPFPEQYQDPWWEVFVDLIRAMDASGFASREDRNLIMSGGGLLSWSASGGGLSWTEDFLVFSPSTGFFSRIVADSVALNDGQVIRAEIVRHPGQNNNVAAEAANIAKNTDDSLLLGIRIGTNFVFRNGMILQDGTVIQAVDFFSGGGGGGGGSGSFKVIPAGTARGISGDDLVLLEGRTFMNGRLILSGHMRIIGRRHHPQVLPPATGPMEVPNNCILPLDPSGGPFTLTLKNRGTPGDLIEIVSLSDDAIPPVITVDGNGPLMSGQPTRQITTAREYLRLRRRKGHGHLVI